MRRGWLSRSDQAVTARSKPLGIQNVERGSTNQSGQEHRYRRPDLPISPYEYGIGSTFHRTPCTNAQVVHRADHILETHEIRAPQDTKDNSTPESADEAFDCFFWGEFDEGGVPESGPPDISEYVVANYDRRGDPEPNESFQNIVDDEVAA